MGSSASARPEEDCPGLDPGGLPVRRSRTLATLESGWGASRSTGNGTCSRRGVVRHNGAVRNGSCGAILRNHDAPRRCSGGAHEPGLTLSIPNLITLARILAVPVILWAITA